MTEEEDISEMRRAVSNHLSLAAHGLAYLAEVDELHPEWLQSRIGFFLQTAEELCPSEHSWPKESAEIYDFITQQKVNQ